MINLTATILHYQEKPIQILFEEDVLTVVGTTLLDDCVSIDFKEWEDNRFITVSLDSEITIHPSEEYRFSFPTS